MNALYYPNKIPPKSKPQKKKMASNNHPIKTEVVRSHLGWMKSLNPQIDGVTGVESNPLSTTDSNSLRVTFSDGSEYVDPDPGHTFEAIYEQVHGQPWSESLPENTIPANMNGFAQNAEKTQVGLSATVMKGFKPEAVPVYKELVTVVNTN